MRRLHAAGAMLFFVSPPSLADKYGLDEIEPSEGSGAGVLVFGAGLVVAVNAWHRYNNQGARSSDALIQAAIGCVLMLAGASMP